MRRWPVVVPLALVLATDAFVAYGATVVHPVTAAQAVARYRASPGRIAWGAADSGPRPGVYLYATTGHARIDRLGIDRRYPAVSARIVRRGAGCVWEEQVALFAEHSETYDSCGATRTGFGTRLTYFFVPSVTDLRCDAAGECADRAHGVTATMTAAIGGTDTVLGRRCRNVTVVTVLRGSNAGGARRELCIDADGLTLRERRSVGVVAHSAFIGTVRYAEEATFTITSLEPLT